MNKFLSMLTVSFAGVMTVLLTASCASNDLENPEVAARDHAKRHERALTLYQEGRYAQAANVWQTMHRDALFDDDPGRAALASYHLGLTAWKQHKYVPAYRHFLLAEQFQKKIGKVQPELTLMLAQADWAAHQKSDRLQAVVAQFKDDQEVPPDLRVQALLITAAEAPGMTKPPEPKAGVLSRAEALYSKLQSSSLKRHLQHVLAVEAARSERWAPASAYLAEAIVQARSGGEAEWMALHTYELGRVFEKFKPPKDFAEQALLSAGMWQSLGKSRAASLVLQNARESVLACGDPDLQELAASLEKQLANAPESAKLRGDLDSILLAVLDSAP